MYLNKNNSSSIASEVHYDDEVGKVYEMIDFDANIIDPEPDGGYLGRYNGEVERIALSIERFVISVLGSNEDAFEINLGKNSIEKAKQKKLGSRMIMFDNFISLRSLDYEFSENVNIFFRACSVLRLQQGSFSSAMVSSEFKGVGVEKEKLFNILVKVIRQDASSKETRRKISNRKFSSERNYKSCKSYIDKIFDSYARVLVIRIDFGYRFADRDEVSLEECQNDMARFNNNKRWNSLFDNVIGYVSKLEYGERKRYHYHLLLFCDGSKIKHDGFLAEKIGRYWSEKVTSNRGFYFNCNRSLNVYKRCGIGMINYYDSEKRNILNEVLRYLTKKEQYLRFKVSEKRKVLTKGFVLTSNEARRGRPRSPTRGG